MASANMTSASSVYSIAFNHYISVLQKVQSFYVFSTVECTVGNVSQHFGIPMIQMSINPLI